ncbi:nodulation protein H-like [Rhodamnia argentea]|uniref:Sulfotransferase n=1 Tax=Rhodamnia argentea TaxID=178133 RepID=A0A8B8PVR2_9MYRT|nr:nodulation protein H-like [Rhodamnia argentea]
MAEVIYFLNKDTLIIKPPKKSPLVYRMIVLAFSMFCGVYICSICLKQINRHAKPNLVNIQITEEPGELHGTKQSDRTSIHYPKPETFSRAECADNPVRYFVIISTQRSGSGWFETLLNSHPNVSSNGEIFSIMDRRKNVSSILQTLDQVYNLDWFSSASKNECSAAVGFKWMLNQGVMDHHIEIGQYFTHWRVSVIFLFRRNLLRRKVSVLANSYDRYAKLLNGTHKSHVHSPQEAVTLSRYKPTINSSSLINDFKEMESAVFKVLTYYNSTRHIVLYYEDLMKNWAKLNEVQEFLDLPTKDLTSRQIKIHSGPLSDHIKNWNDVLKTLDGTSYERFIHAD